LYGIAEAGIRFLVRNSTGSKPSSRAASSIRRSRGQKGTAHAYNLKSRRDQERRWVEQGETAYARFVAGWNARGPKARTGAAKEERQ